jgi:hypothetical protein
MAEAIIVIVLFALMVFLIYYPVMSLNRKGFEINLIEYQEYSDLPEKATIAFGQWHNKEKKNLTTECLTFIRDPEKAIHNSYYITVKFNQKIHSVNYPSKFKVSKNKKTISATFYSYDSTYYGELINFTQSNLKPKITNYEITVLERQKN